VNPTSFISASIPDWTREAPGSRRWDPPRRLIRAIREYQRFRDQPGLRAYVGKRSAVLAHRFWSAITGADVPLDCHIDGGLKLPHPAGVVVHPQAKIGPNCLLFQQVTVGTAGSAGVPTLGGHVEVGAGAKILGSVTIGDHAKIGANSVVLEDVPAGATVVGIPARIVRQRDEEPLDNLRQLTVTGNGAPRSAIEEREELVHGF